MIMAYIGLLLVLIGIVLTFPFVKSDLIKTYGWGINAIGWLITFIYSLITGNILLSIIDFILFIGGLFFCVTNIKIIKKSNNI
jgi:ATP/ADP translocase